MSKSNHYPTVPDSWKSPQGPYRQAPAEYGGEWWFTSWTTGEEPWKTQLGFKRPEPEQTYPGGFVDIFGPRPDKPRVGEDSTVWAKWHQDLKNFIGLGGPKEPGKYEPWSARDLCLDYGIGAPHYYNTISTGYRVRFPLGPLGLDYGDISAKGFLNHPHLFIAYYQQKAIEEGHEFEKVHPLLHD